MQGTKRHGEIAGKSAWGELLHQNVAADCGCAGKVMARILGIKYLKLGFLVLERISRKDAGSTWGISGRHTKYAGKVWATV
jgi:hypothetical protein